MKLLEILEYSFKRKIKNASELSKYDFIFLKLLDSVRSAIFLSSIYDVVLYSSHELLHHDLQIEQISSGRISYYLAFLCLNFCLFDLIRIYSNIRDFDFLIALKYEKAILMVNRDTNLAKIDIKKKKKKGLDISSFEEKIKIAKERKKYLVRNWIYRVGSISTTLTEGLKLKFLQGNSNARFYRFFKIVKVVIFEFCTASLQLLPKVQISIIFLTQLIFFFNTIYYIFMKNIFKNLAWSIVEIFTELTILIFLGMGFVMEFLQREKINYDVWVRLQFYCIFLVVVTSGMNIIAFLITFLGKIIWKLGAIIDYQGVFGKRWANYRISEIDEILGKFERKKTEEEVEKINKELGEVEFEEEVKEPENFEEDGVKEDFLNLPRARGVISNKQSLLQKNKTFQHLGFDKKFGTIPNKKVPRSRTLQQKANMFLQNNEENLEESRVEKFNPEKISSSKMGEPRRRKKKRKNKKFQFT